MRKRKGGRERVKGGERKSDNQTGDRIKGEKGGREEAFGAGQAGRRAKGRPARGEPETRGVTSREESYGPGGRAEGGTGRNESLICASKASPPHFMCQGY